MVQLGDAPPVALQRAAFAKGALTGQFAGSAGVQYAVDLVPTGGTLAGQLVERKMDEKAATLLPRFVRLTQR